MVADISVINPDKFNKFSKGNFIWFLSRRRLTISLMEGIIPLRHLRALRWRARNLIIGKNVEK